MNTKEITILHSNDMHGDFIAEIQGAEGKLIGGLGRLAGYLNKVRAETPNTLYVISGDMVQGSLIDSEYKGISTIEIMNYLAPDVVTLGNHELDYGLAHMLFLEKMANFPIVNANLYIKQYHRRLMQPYYVLNVDGYDILFIGIITEAVLKSIKQDTNIGTFIDLEDAASEVGRICNAYKDQDIDLTVLLTHIGFESDKELAAMLDPAWGVDLIIGGHSHTILDQPANVNGILITQAGTGTDQIGRFDLIVDDDTNSIVDWTWQLLPVNENLAESDTELDAFINIYQQEVDRKYNTIISHLARPLTHPAREQETELGNLFADIISEHADVDVVFVGSGSIRTKSLGPMVTLGLLRQTLPYDDSLYSFTISGAQLRSVFAHVMRPENRTGEGECYQVNRGIRAVYDNNTRTLVSLDVAGEPVDDKASYTILLQTFHYKNCQENIGLTNEELGQSRVVSTSIRDVIEEYFTSHQHPDAVLEGRLVYLG